MKILITGATGMIGSQLVQSLRQHGHTIHYLTLKPEEIRDEPDFKGFLWNPQQGSVDENCLPGVEVIVHLAGAPISKRWTPQYKQEIIESRVVTANVLYRLLKTHEHQVKQFVSASAIGIYPDDLNTLYTEDYKGVDASFLGQVVVKWEAAADAFKLLNLKVCKIRTGLVLSKKGGVLEEMKKPVMLGVGSPFGSGKQWQSWIHIQDMVGLYAFAINHQWQGVYNAVAPHPVTNAQLTRAIAQTLKKPFFMPNIPRWLMKLVLGEMHLLLFTSQKVSSQKAADNGYSFQYRELQPALEHLL